MLALVSKDYKTRVKQFLKPLMERVQKLTLFLQKRNSQALIPENMHVSALPFSLSQTTVR